MWPKRPELPDLPEFLLRKCSNNYPLATYVPRSNESLRYHTWTSQQVIGSTSQWWVSWQYRLLTFPYFSHLTLRWIKNARQAVNSCVTCIQSSCTVNTLVMNLQTQYVHGYLANPLPDLLAWLAWQTRLKSQSSPFDTSHVYVLERRLAIYVGPSVHGGVTNSLELRRQRFLHRFLRLWPPRHFLRLGRELIHTELHNNWT